MLELLAEHLREALAVGGGGVSLGGEGGDAEPARRGGDRGDRRATLRGAGQGAEAREGARAPVSSATAAAGEDAARASARRRLVRATESIVDGGVMRACGVCKPPGRHAPAPD